MDAFQNMTARSALDIAGNSALDLDGVRLSNFDNFIPNTDPLDLKGDPGVSSVVFGEAEPVGVAPVSWSAAKRLYW